MTKTSFIQNSYMNPSNTRTSSSKNSNNGPFAPGISDLGKFAWFLGFSDAEGCFQVYPKKRVLKSGKVSKVNVGYSYHLSLHSRDLAILLNVQDMLNGIGVIYEYKDKSDTRLAINDVPGVLYLIENVFDIWPLLSIHQIRRYNLLKKALLDKKTEFKTREEYDSYMSDILDSLNKNLEALYKNNHDSVSPEYIDNWIVGFINGESCFSLNKGKCNFSLEHADQDALKLIKSRFDFSPNVLSRSPRKRDIGKKRKDMYTLTISSVKDINTLVTFLDNKDIINLQGNKYAQYCEWRKHV